jgi:hypothetical protein
MAIYTHGCTGNWFVQDWTSGELQLYPVLQAPGLVIDFVILKKYMLAVLSQIGIDIWNICTQKSIKSYPTPPSCRLSKIERINSSMFSCWCNYERNKSSLCIYDYRKDTCMKEINEGCIFCLSANLDGRYIAYINDKLEVCIYDTKSLREERTVMLDFKKSSTPVNLVVVSSDRLALLMKEGVIYIINLKNSTVEYTIDGTNIAFICKGMCYLDNNLLVLRGDQELAVFNTSDRSFKKIELNEGDYLGNYLVDFDKYIYKNKKTMKVINAEDYKCLARNKILEVAYQYNEIKYYNY